MQHGDAETAHVVAIAPWCGCLCCCLGREEAFDGVQERVGGMFKGRVVADDVVGAVDECGVDHVADEQDAIGVEAGVTALIKVQELAFTDGVDEGIGVMG